MGMNVASSSGGGGRRGRRKPVVAEINVTPMVDVMLVLLIIFMVSAPMLTVGVPLDPPQTQAGLEERIYLRADKKADYGTVAKVMGQLSGAGFKKLALVTEADQG